MTRFATLALALTVAGCAGDAAMEASPKQNRDAGPVLEAGLGHLALLIETAGALRPGDRVVVRAETGDPVETYSWLVTGPVIGPSDPVPFVVVDPQVGWRRIAFDVGKAGSYQIACTAKLAWGKGGDLAIASVKVTTPNAKKRVYTARIIPPPPADLAPSDYVFEVGSEDQLQQFWPVSSGISKSFAATVDGMRVEAYLRLLSGAADPYPRDIFLGKDPNGGTLAKVSGAFHALVLPLDTRLAPNLHSDLDATTLPQAWVAKLKASTQIGGTVLHAGASLAGAKVTLHGKGAKGIVVPSSIGVTDASGAFQIQAQALAGPGTLTVAPPPGQGLPIAQVEGLIAPAVKQGWTLDYQAATTVLTGGTVRRSDGGKPATGATLVLSMEGGQVGTLTIPGSGGIPVKGRFLITLVSDAEGVLRDPETKVSTLKLPVGSYKAELWPGKAETIEQGYRVSSLLIEQGQPPVELKLAPRAKLAGSVLDRDGKPVLASVTVTSAGSSFVANTDPASGKFTMNVDDNLSYALTARPLETAVRLGSFFQSKLEVAGSAVAEVKLPTAVVVSGQLRTEGNTAVSHALLRVRCASPSCANKEIVDEAQTRANGSFVLRIPTETP